MVAIKSIFLLSLMFTGYCVHVYSMDIFEAAGRIAKVQELAAQDSRGRTPLHYAAENGCVDVVRKLISQRVDVNMQDSWGSSPLHKAIIGSHIEIVRVLLTAGANIEQQNKYGETALQLAQRHGREAVAATIMQYQEENQLIQEKIPLITPVLTGRAVVEKQARQKVQLLNFFPCM